jgi:hypothetical protein
MYVCILPVFGFMSVCVEHLYAGTYLDSTFKDNGTFLQVALFSVFNISSFATVA